MERSILKDKSMPNIFWAEVVYTTIYILNKLSKTKLLSKLGVEETHKLNTYEYLDIPATYMFMIKGCTSLKTLPYKEYFVDITHSQKAIKSITYKQKSSL